MLTTRATSHLETSELNALALRNTSRTNHHEIQIQKRKQEKELKKEYQFQESPKINITDRKQTNNSVSELNNRRFDVLSDISVTPETSHFEISPLKALAPLNTAELEK